MIHVIVILAVHKKMEKIQASPNWEGGDLRIKLIWTLSGLIVCTLKEAKCVD